MFEVLVQVAAAMRAGLAVTVAPHHLLLSTQEAADLLRISRTTLVRLLETGAIPFEKPSRHRKVRLDDLLEYRRRQRSAAELALADALGKRRLLRVHAVQDQLPAPVHHRRLDHLIIAGPGIGLHDRGQRQPAGGTGGCPFGLSA